MVKIILTVEGMACNMCEAHMNEAIENEYKVEKVSSSHKNGQTIILCEKEISEDSLKNTVEKAGYKMVGYSCQPYEKKGIFSKIFKK